MERGATSAKAGARERLLAAALSLIRRQGFAGTSVDELCRQAGVTKGAFFHHFASKEALGVAAADHWSAITGALFAGAPYHRPDDPLDRILAYLDFRALLVRGGAADYSCLAGTLVQETFASQPAIREACHASIAGHAGTLEADFAELLRRRGAPRGLTARSLALHTQAVLQGSFILAKAADDPALVHDGIAHLKRYVHALFEARPPAAGRTPRRARSGDASRARRA
jgi:TetR/AcrR family transcriptional regulator, transcriptional repressor for nem operon